MVNMLNSKLSRKSGCLSVLFVSGLGLLAPLQTKAVEGNLITKPISLKASDLAAYSQGVLRISRIYSQEPDGRIVIEAEEPSRFISENSANPQVTFSGRDPKAGGGRYVSYLKRGWYGIDIKKSMQLVVWHRGFYHATGNWNHDEYLDNADTSINNSDSNATTTDDPSLNRWIWKKGAVYNFSPGRHEFSLAWQGGIKLDQIAFLPEGVAPKDNEILNPAYADPQDYAEALTRSLKLSAEQQAVKLVFDSMPEGGKVEAAVSSDEGKNWRNIPPDASLSSLDIRDNSNLMFRFKLFLSSDKKSPSVFNIGLLTACPPTMNRVAENSRSKLKIINSIDLIPSTWKGVRPNDNGWALMSASVPDASGVVWLDAVKADHLLLSPKQQSWIMEDKDAFSGKAVYQGVLNRNLLSFDFYSPAKTKYRPWFRVKLHGESIYKAGTGGLKGTFGVKTPYIPLMYQVDRGNLVEYSGEKPFPEESFLKKEWVWIPCPAIAVDDGYHTFRVRAGLDYMLFDRVALVPDGSGFTPDGKGGENIRKQAAAAEVTFQPMGWPSNGNIENISADVKSNIDIVYYYSTDGSHWTEAANGIKSIPGKRLFLKASLKPLNAAQASSVSAWAAKLSSENEKVLEFANNDQSLYFDTSSGALLGWHVKKAGWIIPFGNPQNVFGVSLFSSGKQGKFPVPISFELSQMEITENKDAKILQMDFSGNSGDINVLIRIKMADKDLPQWSMQVENKSQLDIRNPEFPLLGNLRIGNDPEDNYASASYPNFGGTDFTAAPYQIASPGADITGFQVKMKGSYPGWHSMGWDSLYTKQSGSFTCQVRDTDGISVYLSLEKDADSNAMKLNLTRKLYIGPGETGVANYAVGWHAGDWHTSADFYSQWAHAWMDFTRINANWAKDADGWASSAFYYDSTYIPTRFVTHLVPELQWLGSPLFQHRFGITDISAAIIPYPNPKLGTPEEFRKGHEASRKLGIHHAYYWNCRGWVDSHADNLVLGFCPRDMLPPEIMIPTRGFAQKNSVKYENGKTVPYGFYPNDSTMCAASKGWNDFLVRGIAYNYGEFLGASVYSDEACGYWDCFDTRHEHGKQHGMYMKGLQDAYRRAIDAARKTNPDSVLIIEGCPDQLMQYADFAIFGLSAYADGVSYQYVFPEAKLLRGVGNPGAWWFMPQGEYTRFIHLFSRYDTHPDSPLKRQFFAHRKRIKDWMYMRRFMDDLNMEISQPGIVAKWFKTEEKGRVGALINIQNEFGIKDASLHIDWPELKKANLASGYLFDEEEVVKLDMKQEGNGVTVSIPPAKASSILIAAEFPKEESLRACMVWPQSQGQDKLVIYLSNLSPDKKEVSLKHILPEGVSLENAPDKVMVKGGTVKRLDIPLDGIQAMTKQDKATVRIDDGTGKKEISCLLAPALCNGNFEIDSAGKGTPDRWRAFGQYWLLLLVQTYGIPFDLNHADGILDPDNPAEGKYSLKLYGSVDLPDYRSAAGTYRSVIDKPVPMLPWFFHTGQKMILKPNSKYRVSFKYRFAADDGVLEVRPSAPGPVYGNTTWQTIQAKPGIREWQNSEFVLPTSHLSEQLVIFANMSKAPLWIDDIKVTEVK